jgi:hypothetical protein
MNEYQFSQYLVAAFQMFYSTYTLMLESQAGVAGSFKQQCSTKGHGLF